MDFFWAVPFRVMIMMGIFILMWPLGLAQYAIGVVLICILGNLDAWLSMRSGR